MRDALRRFGHSLFPLVLVVFAGCMGGRIHTLGALREARRALAFRKRGIILNNDGCDVLYFPRAAECTPEAFLDLRTTALADTQVSAISYCTISSGFSNFTHDTKVGAVLEVQPASFGVLPNRRNVTRELIEQGADCLKLVVDYAHENDMEAFWSMRMNDTHDSGSKPEKLHFLYPKLKQDHPDWLVGTPFERTKHGRWSSVNYALPEIRELAFGFIEEVCENYDVDGIEMDFFRHMCYFPSVANGGKASDEERAMMTGLVRRVRAMTERVGLERGRPILVAVRVADSVEFNRDMGFDLERWLQDGLVDLLVTTGYFRLNPWHHTVKLARKYGVASFPGMSESRIRGETRFRRNSREGYRGRAANAWFAGADGLYYFNSFNPKNSLWRELGSADTLVGANKLYFVNIRDGNPESWLAGGLAYRTIKMLSPKHGLVLEEGTTKETEIMIGEDFAAARRAGFEPKLTACMRVPAAWASQLGLRVNGHVAPPAATVKNHADWHDVTLDPAWLVRGANKLEFTLAPPPSTDAAQKWTAVFEGSKPPTKIWSPDPSTGNVVCEVRDGAFRIADQGTELGNYRYYRHPWGKKPGGKAVIEAEIKIVSGISSLIFGDGECVDRVRFHPDHINIHYNKKMRYEMDTTDGFHTYRVELEGNDIRVFVDGTLRIDAKGQFRAYPSSRNQMCFGAASSGELGEALWRAVRVRGGGAPTMVDFAVRVEYAEKTQE
ncbi:MAG: family 10 glycosylhydrolase [Lentisphaeria bacterium]|nr:family 10 glycosylhydrolase [Lentisphaeria bacterium]